MTESPNAGKLLKRLDALVRVIAAEARVNPQFAARVEAALGSLMTALAAAKTGVLPSRPKAGAKPVPKAGEANELLHAVTFDPLECHLEAALMGGREEEARAFLGKLNRAQLEEVVVAQRLPGAKTLRKVIQEGEEATAVDAIVGSAAERVRNRFSAAS